MVLPSLSLIFGLCISTILDVHIISLLFTLTALLAFSTIFTTSQGFCQYSHLECSDYIVRPWYITLKLLISVTEWYWIISYIVVYTYYICLYIILYIYIYIFSSHGFVVYINIIYFLRICRLQKMVGRYTMIFVFCFMLYRFS